LGKTFGAMKLAPERLFEQKWILNNKICGDEFNSSAHFELGKQFTRKM